MPLDLKNLPTETLTIGGKTAKQLIAELKAANINISDYAKSMMKSREFVPSKNPEEATLIRLTVADLGFKSNATTDQIYERVQILGLELCPADTGPNYRLKYRNQPLNEWIYVGMKPITDSGGRPRVFSLGRSEGGLWLDDDWARPGREWHPGSSFVFRLRKSDSLTLADENKPSSVSREEFDELKRRVEEIEGFIGNPVFSHL